MTQEAEQGVCTIAHTEAAAEQLWTDLRLENRAQLFFPLVQLWTVRLTHEAYTLSMDLENPECDIALMELREQGLTVRLHSRKNNTWHIADGGLYSGYVVTTDELIELKRAKKLNIRGIRDLG